MEDLILKDGDLSIMDGDFGIGESTGQHQELLLVATKGEFKQYPDRGVGVIMYTEDCSPANLVAAIQDEFSRDGMEIKEIGFEDTKLKIDATYKG